MRIPLATAALAIALAGPAQAEQVLHMRADGTTVKKNDPWLPAADLPATNREGPRSFHSRRGARAAEVRSTLHEARDSGAISVEQHDIWEGILDEALRIQAELSGARRNQMTAQLQVLYEITDRGQLTVSRMPALFLQLQRNTEYWNESSVYPASGQRVTFEGSRLVFQYYPGYGLQIQPLANFGKANALWRANKPNNLRELLDELVAISSRRGKFRAWEYFFKFGGGTPPWTSAMSQGTAIQALARASELLADPSYLRVARSGIKAFSTRYPTGVRVRGRDGGNHYLIYSFSRGLRVLNAFAQTLNGLYDYATIANHARAMALFNKGERSLRAELEDYDTGAWSLYSLGGAEATTEYHGLATDFLGNLCDRLGPGPYCDASTRFESYERESPRIEILTTTLKPKVKQYVRFKLSKRSTIRFTVSRRGKVVYTYSATSPHGTRLYGFTPPRRGTYTVTVAATSFYGTKGSASGTITVR